MPEPLNDIDALAAFLMRVRDGDDPWGDPDHAKDWSRALTALVAERDELTARVKNLKAVNSTYVKIVSERDALRQRVAELEKTAFYIPHKHPPADRELRERLLESALQGSGCRLGIMQESDAEELGRQAAWIVNGALAEMQKGPPDGN